MLSQQFSIKDYKFEVDLLLDWQTPEARNSTLSYLSHTYGKAVWCIPSQAK